MVNLPNSSCVIKIGAPPYYNRNNRHGRHLPIHHYPLQHHPAQYHPLHHQPLQFYFSLDMQTWKLIAQLVPLFQYMDIYGEDPAHVPSTNFIKSNNLGFHKNLDVGQYKREELSAKIISDHLVIYGERNERKAGDIGYVTHHFTRRYELPKDYNPDDIVCKLSSDGVLSVSLLPKSEDKPKERIITIHQGGPNDVYLKKTKSVNIERNRFDKNNMEEEKK